MQALNAQPLQEKKLRFDVLNINDGLSQGMINCMVQDHYGFMWFGTKDGLNRYDGYHFVVYRHDAADTASIADNFIQSVFEDSKGRLWIGTASQGLDLLNRETETFTHFRHSDNNDGTITDDHIVAVTEDHDGAIWVSTTNGLNKITWVDQQAAPVIRRYFSNLCYMMIASDGTLWGSSLNNLSFRIHPEKDRADRIDTLDMSRYCSYPEVDNGLEKYIGAAVEDSTHHQLFLFCEYSVASVNTLTGESEIVSRVRNHWGVFGRTHCMDDMQNIWLAELDWLELFNTVTHRWTRILPQNPNLDLLLSNVNITYRDRGGIIWIGTRGYGLLKYNPRSEKFHHTENESIRWIHSTKDNKVLILKKEIFLSIFDPASGAYTHIIRDSAFLHRVPLYKDFGSSVAMVEDSTGIFWSAKNCLVRYDLATNELKRIRPDDRENFPVFIDRDNRVWVGTLKKLSCYDPASGSFTDYDYPVPASPVPYSFIQCIYQDSSGMFWLGTIKGLLRFDETTRDWKIFRNIPGDSSSLSFDVIFTLCPDPKFPQQYLWIGTNGGGLNRFEFQTGAVTRFTVKDGLPNDVVYGILSDSDGNLWISTNNGLCRFNPEKRSFKKYEVRDGLQGNEFNRYAYCKTADGLLFFGGLNGFNYFSPKEVADNPYIPNVEITDFKLRNRSVSFSDKNSPLSKPVYLTDKIVLPYSENMISFEFASLDFASPEKNLYRYRLDGFDHDWIQTGGARAATYTNLDPGTYTFTVLGSNSDGVWNTSGRSIQLIILPPWYLTWWFRIGVVLVLAAMLYALYRYRLRQALKLQAVRNRIASDLHDEIGSNLSNISIFSEVAQQKSGGNNEIVPLLKKISEYTQTSQEAMSDIVWMINARNDRFENIIVRMRTLAVEVFESRNYELHLQIDDRLNDIKLGMEKRKNFYLIYKEAINNIAKYAICNHVWITLEMNHSVVKLTIRDDGKGFQIRESNTGNGLNNMKRRAAVLKGTLLIQSEPDKGTLIELRFPL
jgi:ligand-binding sensor domain-containing protein/signal transduction histidine kinase